MIISFYIIMLGIINKGSSLVIIDVQEKIDEYDKEIYKLQNSIQDNQFY